MDLIFAALIFAGFFVWATVTVFARFTRITKHKRRSVKPSPKPANKQNPSINSAPSPSVAASEKRTPCAVQSTPQPFNPATAHPVPTHSTLCGKAYIVDGDTLKIQKTQIRLFGVDAPEMNHPFGKKAKWALHALCKGQMVTATITDVDTHGRTVAKCTLPDGRDLSAEMVKQGMAIDWPKFSGGIYKHLETPDARKKLWLADARQKGRMHVWDAFDARESAKEAARSTA